LLSRLGEEWRRVEEDVDRITREIEEHAAGDPTCRRLMEIPGIGPMTATALVAAIANGAAFKKGRDFGAWLGLVPRQHSTGGKPRLLNVSKQGNAYLRRLFVLGAQSVRRSRVRSQQRFGSWLDRLELRAHRNVAVVALANKLARIAWAVLAKGEPYRPLLDRAA
jgi:transposase